LLDTTFQSLPPKNSEFGSVDAIASAHAHLSVVDLFTIGIGPSSSHTVGPMRAGFRFCQDLVKAGHLEQVHTIYVDLFGSLALTGQGHGTDSAVLLGLSGKLPDTVNPDAVSETISNIRKNKMLSLNGTHQILFVEPTHLTFNYDIFKVEHPNAMVVKACSGSGDVLFEQEYFSVGGGFVVSKCEFNATAISSEIDNLPYPFSSGAELLACGQETGLSIAEIMFANEASWREGSQTISFLKKVRDCMMACIEHGCATKGTLPGGLNVKRRAYDLYHELTSRPENGMSDPLTILDWINLYALAVNEENAAGGRVVTAPTNGAAGVIPAVLAYYERFCPNATEQGRYDFLLTAAAIGSIYKKRASISAAEVGCQGEVGVACSMAAGALTAVMGGTNEQIENAAEIGMEHNLGLTCDPIGGLVQVPCIERNTMGAMKAINASRLALRGDGSHMVSLDKVIETMRQTGMDMQSKYKETSQGGLAVNMVEC